MINNANKSLSGTKKNVSALTVFATLILLWQLLLFSTVSKAATPIASYTFDQVDWAKNGVVPDSTSTHDAIITGAVVRLDSTNKQSHANTCAAAELSGGAIDISGLPISTTAGDKTSVSFWMYWNGHNAIMPMGWRLNNLLFLNNSFGFHTWANDIYGISSAGLANGWQHVVAVFTNSQFTDNELYINGVKQTLTQRLNTSTNSRTIASSNMRIGGTPLGNSYRFSGAIDEFKIYNGALTQAEVTADYTYTSPAACIDPTPQTEQLIASYNFNDNWSSSNPLQDIIGTANGTINGAVSRVTSTASGNKPDTCAAGEFNGGAIDITGLPVSTSSGDKNSISFWMKWDGNNTSIPLGWSPLSLWFDNGYLGFYSGADGMYGVSSSGLENTWHHITIITTNNDVQSNRIFIDGVEQNLSQVRGTTYNQYMAVNANLRLGGWNINTSRRFNGILDEIKIYTGEITQATIDENRTKASPCSQPVEYRFDETSWSGTTNEVIDSSNNNYHGTAFNTQPAQGLVCNAADFTADSINDYISINNAALNGKGDFSISVWAKTKNTGSQSIISGASGSQHNELLMFFHNSSEFRPHLKGSHAGSIAISNIADAQWRHLVWTRNGTENCIYVDGKKSTCNTLSDQTITIATGGLILGQEQDKVAGGFDINQDFEGLIDELLIFDYPLSETQVNDIRSNQLAGNSWDGEARTCPVPVLDHFEISYAKAGLTCLPSTVTIKACADAACSSLISDDVDITLSPATGWANNPVTLEKGQATLQLNHNTAGTIPLAVTASSITPSNATPTCYADNNLDPACSIDVAETGFVFDVPTITACKPSAAVTIRAIKKDSNSNQCISALTGSKTLSFWSEYDIPNSGSNTVSINNTAIATSNSGTNINLTFDANGEAQFTAQYDDAGRLNLNASYDDGNGNTMTGTDTFVSIPVGLVSYVPEKAASCNSQNANCSVFTKAGEGFEMRTRAACWTDDNDNDYSDNPTTPNFIHSGIGISHNVLAPNNGANGSLATTSTNFTSSDQGEVTIKQAVSEVGVFEFDLIIPDYLDETLSSQTSSPIGRFIPDHFEASTTNNGNFTSNACGFRYSGETFSYDTAPQLLVTAYNAATPAEVTQNYREDFAKLRDTDFSITAPTTDANQLGADSSTLVALNWQMAQATLTPNNKDKGSLTFSFGQDNYTYLKQPNSKIGTFNNAVDLTFTRITDSDNVSTTNLPYSLQPGGQTIQFGRIAIGSIHGSELVELDINITTEVFSGFEWIANTTDSCTTINQNSHIQLSNPDTAGGSRQSGNATMTVSNGSSSGILSGFSNGSALMTFSAPGQDNQGYIDIFSNIGTDYPWLLGDYNNNGSYTDEASGRASFGLFRGSSNIIFKRERY